MAKNIFYITAGLPAPNYVIASEGRNKVYITEGLPPSDIIPTSSYIKITTNTTKIGASVAHQPLMFEISILPSSIKTLIVSRTNLKVWDSTMTVEIPCVVKNFVAKTSGQIYFDAINLSSATSTSYFIQLNAINGVDSSSTYTNSNVFTNYEFDEVVGNPVDDSGNYNGYAFDTSFDLQNQVGKYGRSIYCVSNSNTGQKIPATQINGATKLYISGRIKFNNTFADSIQIIFDKTWTQFTLYTQESAGNILFNLNIGTIQSYATVLQTSLQDGNWHQFDILYDGTGATNADKVKISLDGILKTLTYSSTVPSSIPNLSGTDLRIGAWTISNAFGPQAYYDNFQMATDFTLGQQVTRYNNFFDYNNFWTLTLPRFQYKVIKGLGNKNLFIKCKEI